MILSYQFEHVISKIKIERCSISDLICTRALNYEERSLF